MLWYEVLFFMLVGHALMDYPLQSDFIAKYKNPWVKFDNQTWWPWLLSWHALMHGGAVALVTGSVYLGVLETICHWLIDLAKCADWINIHIDQGLHILCKLVWLFTIWQVPGINVYSRM